MILFFIKRDFLLPAYKLNNFNILILLRTLKLWSMRKTLVLFTATLIIISSSLSTHAASSVVPPPGSEQTTTEVKAAFAELKGLSKNEKKERAKKLREAIKTY